MLYGFPELTPVTFVFAPPPSIHEKELDNRPVFATIWRVVLHDFFRNSMKLSMHSNAEEGLLLIEFDDEGREKLLGDIERTIAQQDHEFDVLDAELTTDEPRGGNWKLNDFYNISWVPDANAPLHVDDSVYISGGKTALMDLYNRIRLLPAGCKELELAAEHCTPRRKRFRFSWLLGGILSFFFLIPTADRFFVAAFSGNDNYWFQMWCYLVIALAVLLMPRLITLRSIWSTRLNAVLGLVSAGALMLLNLEVFGAPSNYFFLPPLACHILQCLFATLFAATALCAFFRRGLRRATPSEQKKLRLSGKLLFILLLNAAIAFALLLGSLMHAVRHCEGKESPAFWHHIVIYVMFFAAITQPLWLLAEVLTAKRLQKICFYLSGLLLIPGLLVAAPVYLCDTGIIGIDSYTLRLPLALLFLLAASGIFFYLRKRTSDKG